MQHLPRPLISIAPMLDISNRHFRYFMRLLSSQTTLYTEMIHYNAILHNPVHHLQFNNIEHPVVLQLGGSDPKLLSEACMIVKKYGYDQINLNVGCPSPRVQEGSFGACLMKQKQLVSQCMKAMKQSVNGSMKCTVKCRLGVDQFDSYQFVKDFVESVSQKGQVDHFIIHARKAYLKGLNPAQNRNIPPLRYELVYKLIQDFPHLKFTINGGIKTLSEAKTLLTQNPNLQGCMIGRTAYQNPYQLANVDELIYNKPHKQLSRYQILYKYAQYIQDEQLQHQVNCCTLVKPLVNLFHGLKFCAKYRQALSDSKKMKSEGVVETIHQIAQYMQKALENLNNKEKKNNHIQQQNLQNKKQMVQQV